MTLSSADSWHPEIPVYFPGSDLYACAAIKHEHNGVEFAIAEGRAFVGDDFPPDCVAVTAHFVSDNFFGGVRYRVSESDFKMILSRCKSNPACSLYLSQVGEHHINAVFRPSGDLDEGKMGEALVDPSSDEEDVTVIRARILEHREVAA